MKTVVTFRNGRREATADAYPSVVDMDTGEPTLDLCSADASIVDAAISLHDVVRVEFFPELG